VVTLKYSEPRIAPLISLSAYAAFTGEGITTTAGGVTFSVCVAPVIGVAGVEKQDEAALGQTWRIHVEFIGEMAVFEGIETEYEPVPLSTPVMTLLSVPPVHVYGPVGNCGLGVKVNWNVPPFHDCAPASVTWPETVVLCPKAFAAPASRKAKARIIFRIALLMDESPHNSVKQM
jgi:hypothetical protein